MSLHAASFPHIYVQLEHFWKGGMGKWYPVQLLWNALF